MYPILCPITEWEEKNARNFGASGVSEKATHLRWIIGATNWNWIVAEEHKENETIKPFKNYTNMSSLLFGLKTSVEISLTFKFDYIQTTSNIVNALAKLTNIHPIAIPSLTTREECEIFGSLIDNTYGTSFLREYPPKTLKRIFKVEAED